MNKDNAKRPVVSVRLMTYNHENYIEQALRGIDMQITDFEFEVVIGDDFSTDGNLEKIKSFKFLNKNITVNLLNRVEGDSYSLLRRKNGRLHNFIDILNNCKGKYIALLDGDDYWTDPLKLQKQVDFLEANPEYSLVCGGFKSVNTVTGEEITAIKDVENSIDNTEQGFDITLERFFKQWLTKTLTLVYRTELYNPNDFKNYKYTRDVHLNYHLLKRGKGYYMKEVFGAYHIHDGGTFSAESTKNNVKNGYLVYKEIYLNDKNSFTKKVYINASRRYLEFFKKVEMPFKEKLIIIWSSFFYINDIKDLKKSIKNIKKLIY